MNPPGLFRRFGSAGAAVAAIILLRGLVLATTPLSFDEAYYWLWSKHLAAGYLDHPPLIAFLIRAGTMMFGDTSVGVRSVPWLISIAASWAVWRTAAKLTGRSAAGAIAALLFNLMPMIAIESGVATPDSPEIAASAFFLFFIVKIVETGRATWWIAAGIAAGFALLAKYTGFFLGAGILAWLAATPRQRHWFGSFWPYAGALIALLIFSPVILWNSRHDWMSFAFQFGRAGEGGFTLRYLGEFLGGQLLLATPFIVVLAAVALWRSFRDPLFRHLRALCWIVVPAAGYFLWHSLHDRVQGNWPSFLYPAIAIAAAALYGQSRVEASHVVKWSRALALPVASILVAAIYGQALFGFVRVRDPVSRLLAYGMDDVVVKIDSFRTREHAAAIATTNYALTGWLAFYLPGHPPVIQLNERSRYVNEPPPDPRLWREPLIYVSQVRNEDSRNLSGRFAHVEPLGRVTRMRNGTTIDEYAIFRIDGPKGNVLTLNGD